ncbi:UvrB/UvrC motif-containing protein [Proteiniborus sp. MB09-C3]|uniref:UvrB/UvrC motif-containing protein n=1 Tax=Proteiniborus sp. MB09-C3 TaxID=3050072 RepID=UPI002552DAFE|nr:UvrB/UvrC motif-containing protein [Proteiniborus sp. MB09-C3]WIV13110.1 UvrB/UvrC motif-containing protein [Proteiniborus sp. MB09-C3]
MLCEECGKNQATVHMKKIINNHATESYLCEECAKKNNSFGLDTSFSIQNILAGLIDSSYDGPVKVEHIKALTCDNCGLTYGKFRQTGKFGCSNCYDSFREKLIPLFKKIHGHDSHVGKIPRKAGQNISTKRVIDKLKEELDLAVGKEEFEKAAQLRDKIRDLQRASERGSEQYD